MLTKDQISEMLHRFAPVDCKVIGRSNVEKLASGVTDAAGHKYGSGLSLGDSIARLIEFRHFLVDVSTIAVNFGVLLAKTRSNKDRVEALEAALKEKGKCAPKWISRETKIEVYELVEENERKNAEASIQNA